MLIKVNHRSRSHLKPISSWILSIVSVNTSVPGDFLALYHVIHFDIQLGSKIGPSSLQHKIILILEVRNFNNIKH